MALRCHFNSLHVHRYSRLAKHNRHLAELLVRFTRNVADLQFVIALRGGSAKVERAGDEHALGEESVPGHASHSSTYPSESLHIDGHEAE